MYHSGAASKIQEHVLSSLKDPEGSVRIVIATTALGMVVDIKGLYWVINYGPPNSMEGRAGRDGKNSEALLLFHGHQLRPYEPEMLDFIKSDTCRRKKMLEQLAIKASYQTIYAVMYVPRIVSVGRGYAQMVREAWVFCCQRPQSLTRKLFQQEIRGWKRKARSTS